MAEVFPDSPRVIYERSPLVEVICQVRFPTILRIQTTLPVEFQEAIRERFPLFEQSVGQSIPDLPPEVARMINPLVRPDGGVAYTFAAEDGQERVSLSSSSLSMNTGRYTRWEDFWAAFEVPLKVLVDQYSPAFYVRVGLRYMDAICRSDVGLTDRPWSALLAPHILGELQLPEIEQHVQEVNRQVRWKFPGETGGIFFRHGLGKKQGRDETCYVIDFDLYTDQKVEVADASSVLRSFNRRAGKAFRWCLTEDLHLALGPRHLDGDQ